MDLGLKCMLAKKIYIESHEGLMSSDISLDIDGDRVSVKNELKSWKSLKSLEEFRAGTVFVRRTKWGGEVTVLPFKESAPYKCRFDKENYDPRRS